MKQVLVISLLLTLVIFSAAQTFKKKYKGAIGPYPVNLTLNSNEGTLTGTYYYESFDDPISIRGFISDKSIEFKGYDLKGNQIDQFIGQLNRNDIQGIWIGEGMQKRYPFKLQEDLNASSIFTPNRSWYLIGSIVLVIVTFCLIFIFRFKKQSSAVTKWVKNIDGSFKDRKSVHQMGFEFEKYMTDKLDPDNYKLLEWHTEKNKSTKKFDSGKYPDLVFERRNSAQTKKSFSIECEYKNKILNDQIDLGKNWKINDYKNYAQNTNKPLFFALGLGGKPSNPESVYIIPVDNIKDEIIDLKEISKFKITGAILNYDPEQQTLVSL